MIDGLRADLRKLADPEKAKILQRFFKTGKGEYGEGDIFLGITVPQSRSIAIKYKNLAFGDIKRLLRSKIHEERLIALLILVHNFKNKDEKEKKYIYDFYLKNTKYINNWDLVDLSADKIVGTSIDSGVVSTPQNDILIKLAKSKNLWERRIAIISTFKFIKRQKDASWTLKIAEILLNDKHDLIQKAVGWMLREVGKQISQKVEEEFLRKYYKNMPRTMLRYAIERFPINLKKAYMESKV
mgnify:CR=1 FL=1